MKLPNPDSIELQVSKNLKAVICREIDQSLGFISFARFMELALYAPGLGYYSAGQHKLGKQGDFMTAPELTPLFARCVAKQCQQILKELSVSDILEFGAGTGVFAKDVLLELEKQGGLPEHYFILEVSAELRARQKKCFEDHCPSLLSRIRWLNYLPEKMNGIIIANEVLDALPVHCFVIENQKVKERCVALNQDEFIWKMTEPTIDLPDYLKAMALSDGYTSEINLMLPGWIHSAAHSLNKGVVLLFDYGYGRAEYYHPDRFMGTLMCYHQHRSHDNPFVNIGLQDITAHVDFTHVIESASIHGFELAGYNTQAGFLMACDLLSLAKENESMKASEYTQQNWAIKKLLLPSEMGESIKVMALRKNCDIVLQGFSLQDRGRDL